MRAIVIARRRLPELGTRADVLCAALVALAAFRLLHQAVKLLLESRFIDLAYHYFFATMARNGLDLYDPAHVEMAARALPLRRAGGEALYAPSYFVFFQPLTWMPFGAVALLWLLVSHAAVIAAVAAVVRDSERRASGLAIAFAALLVAWYQPLAEDLSLGNNNTVLFGLATLAWCALRRDRPWVAGAAVGAMAFVKIPFGALMPLLALLGSWPVAAAAALAWAALFFAGLPQLGAAHYVEYVAAVGRLTARAPDVLENLSFNGLWHRLLDDASAQAVYLVTSVALVAAVVSWTRRAGFDRAPETGLLLAVTLVPLLSPYTEEHHLVVTLLPLLVASLRIDAAGASGRALYVAALVLLASRYSWNRFADEHAAVWRALLSAKLVGVLLLLGVLLHLGTRKVSRWTA